MDRGRSGEGRETATDPTSWSARCTGTPETGKTDVVGLRTQRSQIRSCPRYQVRGPRCTAKGTSRGVCEQVPLVAHSLIPIATVPLLLALHITSVSALRRAHRAPRTATAPLTADPARWSRWNGTSFCDRVPGMQTW
jgi:hypothetical protein